MKKENNLIILGVLLIATIAAFLIYFKSFNKPITNKKVYIAKNQIDYFKGILSNYELTDQIDQANIVISENQISHQNWQSELLYAKYLDLVPAQFGKFCQGEIPDCNLKIYLSYDRTFDIKDIQTTLTTYVQNNPPSQNTLLAVGDIMLSRNVDKMIDLKGIDYIFEKVSNTISSADLAFANLESPVTNGNSPRSGMSFGMEEQYVVGLKTAGFDALNLANNHFGNQGQSGMLLTFEKLKANDLAFFGANTNRTESRKPLILTKNNTDFAFLGYSDTDVLPSSYIASQNRAGVNAINLQEMIEDVALAKKQVDLVIVSMHSGTEYTPNPNNRQKEFAHAAIDAGADIVIGHHPHVVQALEQYKGKFIFYSLGNFVFDQYWSKETQQGIMLKISVEFNKIIALEMIPIAISNSSQPSILEDQSKEYEEILNRIFNASANLL